MRVVESGSDRFTIDIENVNSVWLFVCDLRAGDLVPYISSSDLSLPFWGLQSVGVRQQRLGPDQAASYTNAPWDLLPCRRRDARSGCAPSHDGDGIEQVSEVRFWHF